MTGCCALSTLEGKQMGDRYQQRVGDETALAFVNKLELETWGSFAENPDPDETTVVCDDAAIVEWSRTAKMPTCYGTFSVRAFRDRQNREHAVLFLGDMAGQSMVPVRVHSECLTSEVLGSLRCDCKAQLDLALQHIAERRIGMLIYLRQEGRGTGLLSKIDAYALQDTGLDTVEAGDALGVPVDARTYELAGEVIRLFDIASISLLTNNPAKIDSLRRQGVDVAHRTPMLAEPNEFNDAYLRAKKLKMSHLF
jgi:GTP cyclohydrolase II